MDPFRPLTTLCLIVLLAGPRSGGRRSEARGGRLGADGADGAMQRGMASPDAREKHAGATCFREKHAGVTCFREKHAGVTCFYCLSVDLVCVQEATRARRLEREHTQERKSAAGETARHRCAQQTRGSVSGVRVIRMVRVNPQGPSQSAWPESGTRGGRYRHTYDTGTHIVCRV